MRRAAEVAKLFADCGVVAICSFVSPFEADRRLARKIHEDFDLKFFEVFVQASVKTCEARDVKGLYEKARKGLIKSFTGIGQNYETPRNPDLVVNTEVHDLEASTRMLIDFLRVQRILPEFGETVEELFVDEKEIEKARKEAENFPSTLGNSFSLFFFFYLILILEGYLYKIIT